MDCPLRASFCPSQRHDRIQPRRPYRRVEAKDHPHRSCDGKRQYQRRRRNDQRPPSTCTRARDRRYDHSYHQPSDQHPQQEPDCTANQAQEERLDQELVPDIASPRSYGHANTNLSRALRHRDQHDIHNADDRDRQRYGRDARQDHRDDLRRLILSLYDLHRGLRLEIVALPAADMVVDLEGYGDFLHHLVNAASAVRLEIDLVKDIIFTMEQARLYGCIWHIDHIILSEPTLWS